MACDMVDQTSIGQKKADVCARKISKWGLACQHKQCISPGDPLTFTTSQNAPTEPPIESTDAPLPLRFPRV